MTISFHELQLPKKPVEYQLTKLPGLSQVELMAEPGIGSSERRLIRSLDRIIADIQEGNTAQITQLEWIYYLYSQSQKDTHRELSRNLWETAKTNPWLKSYLLWRLAWHFSREKEKDSSNNNSILPSSLIKGFSEFEKSLQNLDRLPIQIINIIPKSEAETEIANLCWQKLYTPIELMEKAKLPTQIPVIQRAFPRVVTNLVARNRSASKAEFKWLLRCLQQMSFQQQLTAVEELLATFSGELKDDLPQLAEWIRTQYQHRSHLLSSQAQTNLQRWVATLNYSYFQQVTNLVLRLLSLPEAEVKTIEELRDFWANYSDRFQNLRLLLPQSSLKTISYQLPCDVDPLTSDGSDTTEVSIFELNQHFVIEFWRGIACEARLLPKTSQNEKLLFGTTSLSVKHLRKLPGKVCDRTLFWQPHCEKWLKDYKILPNPNLEYFQGLSQDKGRYNRSTGLPLPNAKEQKQRESALKQWRREIEKL